MRLSSVTHPLIKGLCLAGLFTFGWLQNAQAQTIHLKDAGFATPEAMEYYPDEDVYLVANINGSPFDKDDNGFISKLGPDGNIIDLKWLDGEAADVALNAPKGMTILNNRLYIADIDRIRVFELPGGKQLKDIIVPGSRFMNGLSVASDTALYATDSGMAPGFKPSGTDAVYRISTSGKIDTLQTGALGHPNGIIANNTGSVMVTLGSGQAYFMEKDGHIAAKMTLPFNRLDGLLKMDDGRFITSSWAAKAIVAINPDYTLTTLAEGFESPADLGYDSKRKRLLIPLFLKNEVVILPLE